MAEAHAWHAGEELLRRYAAGGLDSAGAWSVESHLPGCADCRRLVAPLVTQGRVRRSIDAVLDTLEAPRPRPVERLLVRLGVRETTARLLAATPSLTLSWLLAVGLVLVFALGAAVATGGQEGFTLFLLLAPLLPLAGVAAAFGPGVDPTYEIGVAAPLSSFRVLLIRAVAVLATTTAMAGAASLLLPATLGLQAAAWLLPSLCLTLVSLALTPVTGLRPAVAGCAAAWVSAVVALARDQFVPAALTGPPGQTAFALAALAAALALVASRRRFDQHRTPTQGGRL